MGERSERGRARATWAAMALVAVAAGVLLGALLGGGRAEAGPACAPVPVPPAPAADQWWHCNFPNNNPAPASHLEATFSGTGGQIVGALVTLQPAGCGAAAVALGPPPGPDFNEVRVKWPGKCIPVAPPAINPVVQLRLMFAAPKAGIDIADWAWTNNVGGLSEDPEAGALPLETSNSSGPNTGVLAATIAGAVLAGAIGLGSAAWYVRRRVR